MAIVARISLEMSDLIPLYKMPAGPGRNGWRETGGKNPYGPFRLKAVQPAQFLPEGLVDRGPAEADDAGNFGDGFAVGAKLADGLLLLDGEANATARLAATQNLALGAGGGLAGKDAFSARTSGSNCATEANTFAMSRPAAVPRSRPSFNETRLIFFSRKS